LSEHDDHAELPVAVRVRRLEERLIDAGLASDAELDGYLARLYRDAAPVNGARMAARAWTDPGYRSLLLSDGNAAASELGLGELSYQLRVVANSDSVHNVIVCTLCSCYPVSLLGPSPGWYKSFAYRSRTVREPRAVLAEFGVALPAGVPVSVWDSTSEARYMVLPSRPAGTGSMGPDELAALVTLNGLIGTALVLASWADDGDRAVGVVHGVGADGAEQGVGETAVAAAAHDQQLGAFGCLDENLGWVALDHAAAQGRGGVGAEDFFDGFVERLGGEVGQSVVLRRDRYPAVGRRIVPRGDDLKNGAGVSRLPRGPAQGLPRALGAVDPDHNPCLRAFAHRSLHP
jgi:nitrile hydratase